MKGKDEIKELFSDKLGGYEANVRPELWTNISSQLASTATTTSAGLSIVAKTLIGIGIVAATVTGIVLLTTNNTPQKEDQKTVPLTENTIGQTVEVNEPEKEVENTTSTTNVFNEVSTQQRRTETLPIDVENDRLANEDDPLQNIDNNTTDRVDNSDQHSSSDAQNNTSQKDNSTDNSDDDNSNQSSNQQSDKQDQTDDQQDDTVKEDSNVSIPELELPNVCTPNNDLDNDEYFILSGNENLSDFSVFIYNTRGDIVYRSNDPFFKWNGVGLDNQAVEDGMYVCVIIASHESGEVVKKSKQFQIVR